MSAGVGNIRIEPANVTHEIEEQSLIKTVADSSDSLDGTYFTLGTAAGDGSDTHYVWFDGPSAPDPAPAGLTAIAVSYTTDGSAATIASELESAINGDGTFIAAIDTPGSNEVFISNSDVGTASQAADSTTGFSFTRCQEGGEFDLGLLDGDIEVSFEETLLDVTAHQTGTTLRAKLRQGISAEVSLTLKETDLDKLYRVFALNAGGGTSDQFGWGDARQGSNVIVQSRRLNLHPVALGDSDLTRDLTFWKTYLQPTSLTYSGENPNVIEVTFSAFIDDRKDDNYNLFKFGDYTVDIP